MGPTRDLAIRPLGLGEVIDRAVALTRRHFRPLFLAMLVLEAPALALAHAQQARTGELLGLVSDPVRAGAALAPLGASFAALLAVLLALQLAATAAAAAIVAPSLDPRGAAGPSAARRVLAVSTSGAVQLAALAVAPAAGALPGIVLAVRAQALETRLVGIVAALVGSLGLFLLALVRLVLVPAVAAVEGRGGVSAALRSWRLMAPRRGSSLVDRPGVRASLVLMATFLLALAVNGVAGVPRAIAARVAGTTGPLGLLGTLPLAAEVPISLFEAAASAALQPFSLVAVAVLYFDRRARTEALDVEIWAAQLEGER